MTCSFDGCGRSRSRLSWCATHYNQHRKGEVMKPIGIKGQWDYKRVLSETIQSGDCMLFRPHLTSSYPVVRLGKRNYLAHRFVFEGVYGELPEGSHVHHKCANRFCVNPEHLQRASAAENTLEMVARRDYEAEIAGLRLRIVELEAQLEGVTSGGC